MLYNTPDDWLNAPAKRILFFGMSGLGKTHVSNALREAGAWFHYSVDYRIGTRYMGEYIVDNFKAHAMRDPFLAQLLRSDSIYIASNITFDNLAPLSTYLGQPGDPAKGGLPIAEYKRRQAQHARSEVQALLDATHFITRAKAIYGYDHFVCDTGGSICEVANPEDPNDPVLKQLAESHLMVWIKGSEDHTAELVRRFEKAPKPMCYDPEFIEKCWTSYLNKNNILEPDVDPDDFTRWTYSKALAHRQPRYQAMADRWGITVTASDVAKVQSPADLDQLIADALGKHQTAT